MKTGPHQVLAANLTLSQLGGADYANPILMSPPRDQALGWDIWTNLIFSNLKQTHKNLHMTLTYYGFRRTNGFQNLVWTSEYGGHNLPPWLE